MSMTAYPAAREVSRRVLHQLEQQAQTSGSPLQVPPLPGVDAIERIVEAGFWASLHREEGRTPLLSLAFVAPGEVRRAIHFERPVPLSPEPLARVAPAVERPGIHLGVWEHQGELQVWGATRTLPRHCFVLEVIAPGFLVVKQSRGDEPGKFLNIAVLRGDDSKIVDHSAAAAPDCPHLVHSLLGIASPNSVAESANVLIQLAISMRAHGRGGILLVVPAGTGAWRESVVHPVLYSVAPPFPVLTELMEAPAELRIERWWQDALERAVGALAGLTAVDGAAVMTTRYELLAFGAKIIRRLRHPPVSQVVVTEPIEDSVAETLEPAQLGGTRHLSAAQFASDQPDSVALVASQDGRFTVFAWSPCAGVVHAHRIETLLL